MNNKKIFIDCGANKGQSINAFLREFPDQKNLKFFHLKRVKIRKYYQV